MSSQDNATTSSGKRAYADEGASEKSAAQERAEATKAAQQKLLGEGFPTAAQVEEVLIDWDGKDLLEGVRMLSDSFPAYSLKESLMLTELVEDYRKHGMGYRPRG